MALRLLEQRAPGVSLLEAVKGYVELVAKIRNPITMSELAKQYAESKQSRGRSAGHVKDLKFRLKKFGEKATRAYRQASRKAMTSAKRQVKVMKEKGTAMMNDLSKKFKKFF